MTEPRRNANKSESQSASEQTSSNDDALAQGRRFVQDLLAGMVQGGTGSSAGGLQGNVGGKRPPANDARFGVRLARLIGEDRFTHLPLLADFLEETHRGGGMASLSDPDQDPDWVGEIPVEHRCEHRPRWAWMLQQRLAWVLAHPIQTERASDGSMRLQAMGARVVERDAAGDWRVYGWRVNADEAVVLVQGDVDEEPIGVLDQPLRWLGVYRAGLVRAVLRGPLRTSPPADGSDPGARMDPDGGAARRAMVVSLLPRRQAAWAYVRWLVQRWVKVHWSADARGRLAELERDAMGRFFGFDPACVSVARRIHGDGARALRLQRLPHLALDMASDVQFLQDAPQLLLLRRWLDGVFESKGDRLQVMRQEVRAEQLSLSMWRLLVREGSDWMAPFIDYFDCGGRPGLSEAMQILLLAECFGTQALPPAALLHGWMSLGGNPNRPQRNMAQRLWDLNGLARRLGVLWYAADAPTRQEMDGLAHEVFQWGDRYWATLDPRSQKHIRWAGLKRRVLDWQAEERLEAEGGSDYGHAMSLRSLNPAWEAVVLNSTLDVWMEGQSMRHCAFKFEADCASGRSWMVSIRERGTGQRLATALYRVVRHAEGVRVDVRQASGWANQKLSARLWREVHWIRGAIAVEMAVEMAEVRGLTNQNSD